MNKPRAEFIHLDKKIHDRKSFDSGEAELNDFIKKHAAKNDTAGVSKTFVFAPDTETAAPSKIRAFFLLSAGEVRKEGLGEKEAKKLPRYPVPVILISQMAVDKRYLGAGLGSATLFQALKKAYNISKSINSYAVVVDCLNDDLIPFYEKYGFKVMAHEGSRTRMYLPINTLDQLVD